jgi:DNA-binding GntR family transcriptional regulator
MTTNRALSLKQHLEDAIVSGEYAPGAHLDELGLAEKFGVSRTPIREALAQLGAEGLIEIRPRRGAFVSTPSPRRLLEMFETMAELEAACGRFAAMRLTDEDDAALNRAHEGCITAAQAPNPDAYYAENRLFHEAIYRASRNSFLAEQAFALHKRLSSYRRIQLRARNRLTASLAEHEGVLEALRAGDADKAATRLRAHILVQGERFTDMMRALSLD